MQNHTFSPLQNINPASICDDKIRYSTGAQMHAEKTTRYNYWAATDVLFPVLRRDFLGTRLQVQAGNIKNKLTNIEARLDLNFYRFISRGRKPLTLLVAGVRTGAGGIGDMSLQDSSRFSPFAEIGAGASFYQQLSHWISKSRSYIATGFAFLYNHQNSHWTKPRYMAHIAFAGDIKQWGITFLSNAALFVREKDLEMDLGLGIKQDWFIRRDRCFIQFGGIVRLSNNLNIKRQWLAKSYGFQFRINYDQHNIYLMAMLGANQQRSAILEFCYMHSPKSSYTKPAVVF